MGTTYRCLIVDDESPAHKALISHIGKFADLEYSGSAYSGKEALEMLRENPYDIIFLDINMPLLSGVEFMEIQPVRPLTIVTTAYSDFALSAYENDAIDYLLKPISLGKFTKAIEKAKTYHAGNTLDKSTVNTERVLSLKVNGEAIRIAIHTITYIESIGNYLKLHRQNEKLPLVIYGTLLSITEAIAGSDFVQSHRSFIVNKAYVKNVSQGQVYLIDGSVVPIGRKYQILLG